MRVNIGYGCQLDEVLEESASLTSRAGERIRDLAATLHNISLAMRGNGYSSEDVLDGLHNARVVLARVDLRLDDISVIISSYEDAQRRLAAGEPMQSAPDPQVIPEPTPVPKPTPKKRKARKKKAAKNE